MKKSTRNRTAQRDDHVRVIVKAGDASKDFYVSHVIARREYRAGRLSVDATNSKPGEHPVYCSPAPNAMFY